MNYFLLFFLGDFFFLKLGFGVGDGVFDGVFGYVCIYVYCFI